MSEKKEYIERGALLKAFGCENAVKYGNKSAEQQHNSYSSMMLYEIADEINDSPAADVEPVVRCKDCVKWGMRDCKRNPCAIDISSMDEFCSDGERKAHMERSGSGE